LCGLEFPSDENVLVGLQRADDAGVYRVTDEIALIQTVDFFTPIVDDPYWFGQIAAANALSDVYAMGGVPKTAMNLVGFPSKTMDIGILRRILQGGLDKIREAGVVLIGGHSVEDKEIKYGLSVTGFIHPARVLTKKALQGGDRLILTKPLGTGIINTAIKANLVAADLVDRVTRQMAHLNRDAALIMEDFRVHACTDITGFGLLGHLAEMVLGSGCGIKISAEGVPVLPGTLDFARMGIIPGGAHRNRDYRQCLVDFADTVEPALRDAFYDPQTSGGLLISVDAADADQLLAVLCQRGKLEAALVGEVTAGPTERIAVV
jgi:selenide, water dikinase